MSVDTESVACGERVESVATVLVDDAYWYVDEKSFGPAANPITMSPTKSSMPPHTDGWVMRCFFVRGVDGIFFFIECSLGVLRNIGVFSGVHATYASVSSVETNGNKQYAGKSRTYLPP